MKRKGGFNGMDPEKQKAISSLGGTAAHKAKKAHQFTPDEARAAGKKGSAALLAKYGTAHMSQLGKISGAKKKRIKVKDEKPFYVHGMPMGIY